MTNEEIAQDALEGQVSRVDALELMLGLRNAYDLGQLGGDDLATFTRLCEEFETTPDEDFWDLANSLFLEVYNEARIYRGGQQIFTADSPVFVTTAGGPHCQWTYADEYVTVEASSGSNVELRRTMHAPLVSQFLTATGDWF